jgi:hypothetical protein
MRALIPKKHKKNAPGVNISPNVSSNPIITQRDHDIDNSTVNVNSEDASYPRKGLSARKYGN